MSDPLTRWADAELAYWAHFAVERPEFRNRCVQVAYSAIESFHVAALRNGHRSLWSGDVLETLRVIDHAWSEPTGLIYWATPRYEVDADAIGAGKLGYSTDPDARLRQLQTGCPVRLALEYTAPGTEGVERALQAHLEAERLNGEWFRLSETCRRAVGKLVLVGRAWAALQRGIVV